MGRTVIIGDVHGCTGELEDLLDRVRFSQAETDRLVLVGDVVARGPGHGGALALMKRLNATSARGNHLRSKLLAWRRRAKPLRTGS